MVEFTDKDFEHLAKLLDALGEKNKDLGEGFLDALRIPKIVEALGNNQKGSDDYKDFVRAIDKIDIDKIKKLYVIKVGNDADFGIVSSVIYQLCGTSSGIQNNTSVEVRSDTKEITVKNPYTKLSENLRELSNMVKGKSKNTPLL